MIRIDNLTSEYKQKIRVRLDNGKFLELLFEYFEQNQSWFFTYTYEDVSVGKYKLVNSPNILRENISVRPFGIACSVSDGFEPFLLDDFVSNRVEVYVLSQTEMKDMENDIFTKVW